MYRTAVLLYGIVAYVLFLVTFLYLVGFLTNHFVVKSVDSGIEGSLGTSLAINALLIGLFAVQHSVMARRGFKVWLTRFVPPAAERSTFVLAAGLVLALIFWLWRPLPAPIWSIETPWLQSVLYAIALSGVAIVLYTSFLTNHFDLFGLRQVWLHFRGRPYTQLPFTTRSLYHVVRHPMMLGMLLLLWSTPLMTVGHLAFAALMTSYVMVGIWFEERGMMRSLDDYAHYRETTPMLVPLPRWGRRRTPAPVVPRTNVV